MSILKNNSSLGLLDEEEEQDEPDPSEKSKQPGVLVICFLIYLALILIFSFVVNSALLAVFVKKPCLRTSSNRFVIQLLIVNLLSSCLMQPVVLLEVLDLPLPGECLISEYFTAWVSSLSLHSTLLIGGDQYLAVQYPLRYRQKVTRWRAIAASLLVSLVSSVLAALPLLSQPRISIWPSCPVYPRVTVGGALAAVIQFLFCFLVPVIMLAFLYTKIFNEAHNCCEGDRLAEHKAQGSVARALMSHMNLLTLGNGQLEVPGHHRHSGASLHERRSLQEPANSFLMHSPNFSLANYKFSHDHHHRELFRKTSFFKTSSVGHGLQRKESLFQQTHLDIKASFSDLRRKFSQNGQSVIHHEEGKVVKLYIISLASVVICWCPLYLTLLAGLHPGLASLPHWSLYPVISLSSLYSLLSPAIFAYRNQKVRRELKKMFFPWCYQQDKVGGLPKIHRNHSSASIRRDLQKLAHFQSLFRQSSRDSSKQKSCCVIVEENLRLEVTQSLLAPPNSLSGSCKFERSSVSSCDSGVSTGLPTVTRENSLVAADTIVPAADEPLPSTPRARPKFYT